ncbi:hypothetical protein [Carnobacterium funditum]|uniref:hypothetical protein n=2 Tax=Carnobacterium funditum TaxID=2752 RepID=UPI0006909439|nr:hypothetical protein [Carnobacterium funditum]
MESERLFLIQKNECYRFNIDLEVIACLLLTDTFSEAPKEYSEAIMDNNPDPSENFIFVQVGVTRELSEQEREELLSFTDGLLIVKHDIDYFVDFFDINKEIQFNYPHDIGSSDLITKVNTIFETDIEIKNVKSFNNLLQN